jgi:aspartyl-tRNA(Asn)/glutamyl-tRNA(Gln) amidotransferase subunit A
MCLGALASQTGGSITRPAAYCGVVGCKPTYCRVSVDGVVPLAASIDHPGPMAACVRDVALILQTIAGHDRRDPHSSDRPVPDYLQHIERRKSIVPRLGRMRGLFEQFAEPAVRSFMEDVHTRLRQRGAVLADVPQPASFGEVISRHRTVMAVEAAAFHAPRLERVPHDYEPRIRSLLEEGLACTAPEYARCKEHQRQLTQDMLGCFADVDVLLTPATTSPAPDAATTGDPAFNSPWSYVGFPTVCLPAGWSPDGLPLSIQLIGRPWAEADVLAAAAWCEDALAFARREPNL